MDGIIHNKASKFYPLYLALDKSFQRNEIEEHRYEIWVSMNCGRKGWRRGLQEGRLRLAEFESKSDKKLEALLNAYVLDRDKR